MEADNIAMNTYGNDATRDNMRKNIHHSKDDTVYEDDTLSVIGMEQTSDTHSTTISCKESEHIDLIHELSIPHDNINDIDNSSTLHSYFPFSIQRNVIHDLTQWLVKHPIQNWTAQRHLLWMMDVIDAGLALPLENNRHIPIISNCISIYATWLFQDIKRKHSIKSQVLINRILSRLGYVFYTCTSASIPLMTHVISIYDEYASIHILPYHTHHKTEFFNLLLSIGERISLFTGHDQFELQSVIRPLLHLIFSTFQSCIETVDTTSNESILSLIHSHIVIWFNSNWPIVPVWMYIIDTLLLKEGSPLSIPIWSIMFNILDEHVSIFPTDQYALWMKYHHNLLNRLISTSIDNNRHITISSFIDFFSSKLDPIKKSESDWMIAIGHSEALAMLCKIFSTKEHDNNEKVDHFKDMLISKLEYFISNNLDHSSMSSLAIMKWITFILHNDPLITTCFSNMHRLWTDIVSNIQWTLPLLFNLPFKETRSMSYRNSKDSSSTMEHEQRRLKDQIDTCLGILNVSRDYVRRAIYRLLCSIMALAYHYDSCIHSDDQVDGLRSIDDIMMDIFDFCFTFEQEPGHISYIVNMTLIWIDICSKYHANQNISKSVLFQFLTWTEYVLGMIADGYDGDTQRLVTDNHIGILYTMVHGLIQMFIHVQLVFEYVNDSELHRHQELTLIRRLLNTISRYVFPWLQDGPAPMIIREMMQILISYGIIYLKYLDGYKDLEEDQGRLFQFLWKGIQSFDNSLAMTLYWRSFITPFISIGNDYCDEDDCVFVVGDGLFSIGRYTMSIRDAFGVQKFDIEYESAPYYTGSIIKVSDNNNKVCANHYTNINSLDELFKSWRELKCDSKNSNSITHHIGNDRIYSNSPLIDMLQGNIKDLNNIEDRIKELDTIPPSDYIFVSLYYIHDVALSAYELSNEWASKAVLLCCNDFSDVDIDKELEYKGIICHHKETTLNPRVDVVIHQLGILHSVSKNEQDDIVVIYWLNDDEDIFQWIEAYSLAPLPLLFIFIIPCSDIDTDQTEWVRIRIIISEQPQQPLHMVIGPLMDGVVLNCQDESFGWLIQRTILSVYRYAHRRGINSRYQILQGISQL